MKHFSNSTQVLSMMLCCIVLVSSCVSSTVIRSYPENATIRVDGVDVGTTPYTHSDSKIVMSSTQIRLTKEGYRDLNTDITKDEELDVVPAVAGFFFAIPWLWALTYKSSYTFDLKPEKPTMAPTPLIYDAPDEVNSETEKASTSKLEKLRELKTMQDEGLISTQDYEDQKAKILSE